MRLAFSLSLSLSPPLTDGVNLPNNKVIEFHFEEIRENEDGGRGGGKIGGSNSAHGSTTHKEDEEQVLEGQKNILLS